jgi:hypothetical protein
MRYVSDDGAGGLAGKAGAADGVDAVRYAKAPSNASLSPKTSAGASPFGIVRALQSEGSILLALLIGAVGLLTASFVFADELGTGPRSRRWRARWRFAIRSFRSRR